MSQSDAVQDPGYDPRLSAPMSIRAQNIGSVSSRSCNVAFLSISKIREWNQGPEARGPHGVQGHGKTVTKRPTNTRSKFL